MFRAGSRQENPGMTKTALHMLKGVGYVISTVSVVLLAIVSWKSASQSPLLIACLLVGATASIAGMLCRWLTYEIEKRREGK
ncbi:hypothetical protein DBIPINDM_008462 (plasmid) [Mesorhizobium sp. AR02]|uniref:hypothetical protein n=1 Tax=Mesorhizobium sp. AR02 TaxID=2865837 RepID=UPI00216057F6|nr:hypothetical protein [Mesorhizobium sp. AR02]UVK57486.1 hypothetical protein DBIPINDM_008462 [Mesorhizobium sp. AR02]